MVSSEKDCILFIFKTDETSWFFLWRNSIDKDNI